MDKVIHYVSGISFLIGAIGILVVSTGVVRMFFNFVIIEAKRRPGEKYQNREHERRVLGSYLLLGLEFLIAADIVETILKPTVEDLAILGGVVIIRTILGYFLNKEMAEAET